MLWNFTLNIFCHQLNAFVIASEWICECFTCIICLTTIKILITLVSLLEVRSGRVLSF